MLVRHYEWAGYDVLAITDHWVRTDERSTAEAARHPVDRAERAVRRARARRARARARRRGRPGDPGRRVRAAPGGRRLDRRRTAASRTSRTRTGAGCAPSSSRRARGSSGIEVWNAGCELEVGRGDSTHPLGRGARARPPALRARDRRLAPPRLRQRLRLDDGAGGGADAGGGARRAAQRRLLRLDRPRDPRASRSTDDAVTVRCSPAASVTLYSGRAARRAGERGPARLSAQDSKMLERDDDGLITAVRLERPCEAPLRPRRGRRRSRPPGLDEPAVDRVRARSSSSRSRRFDLLVIGGGIIGAGIAEAATAHGLAVALVDKGDFARRDLERVVEADPRRAPLPPARRRRPRPRGAPGAAAADARRRAAPRPPAAVPASRSTSDGPYRPWFVQSGIVLYSTLARARLNGLVGVERAQRMVPQLRAEGLRSCALYADAWTNDGRLTLANVRARRGRAARSCSTTPRSSRCAGATAPRCVADGRTIAVRADRGRERERPVGRPRPPARGSGRAAVDAAEQGRPRAGRRRRGLAAALTIPHDKVRVSFAVPWEGMLLLGTTDTLHDGEPERSPSPTRTSRRCSRRRRVAVDGLGPARASFAGLRVLPGGEGETASARRETVYSTGPSGMVSVAGGKLTTYRRIALDALDACSACAALSTAVRGRCRARPGSTASRGRGELDRRDAGPPAPPVRLARARGAGAGGRRPVAARAARPRPPRRARAGAVRAHARVGA